MSHQFSRVPKVKIPRSTFNRSHGHKTTFDGGYLVPIFVDEALPGDSFNLKMTAFARLATPLHPIMDNMRMETFFFAVPNRLLWDNWEKFCGEQENPGDSTDYTVPRYAGSKVITAGDVEDYMGIPTGIPASNMPWNVLHLRAYNRIYNDWFRDQNLQDSVPNRTGDSGDVADDYALLRRGKRHDYFTSCLPFPQKGDPVSVSLTGQAPVTGIGVDVLATSGQAANGTLTYTDGSSETVSRYANSSAGTNFGIALQDVDTPAVYADLTQASSFTINELREAFQIQRLLERDARGGTRYIEIVKSHFGVTSPDARLQRSEYLGGGSSPVSITPIPSTVPADIAGNVTPQGNLAAVGTTTVRNHGFTKSFTEHCVLIGLVNVRADLTYQQGLDRMWSRSTRYDFFWPALAHLGEQAVLSKEIYADGTAADDDVFGYQERYAEYRYKPTKITGKFRSTDPQSLDIWHLSQEFSTRPTLSATFIEDNPPIDRVVATPDEPHFLFDAYFDLKCARPMPLYGVPGYIDHF